MAIGSETRAELIGRNHAPADVDPSAWVRDVVDRLSQHGCRARKVGRPLLTFINRLSKLSYASAVGLAFRDQGYVRPVLDVCLLWSAPLDFNDDEQAKSMDCVGEIHASFAKAIDPHFDTFLDFVDPASFPRSSDFQDALEEWAHGARRSQVVGFRELRHPARRPH